MNTTLIALCINLFNQSESIDWNVIYSIPLMGRFLLILVDASICFYMSLAVLLLMFSWLHFGLNLLTNILFFPFQLLKTFPNASKYLKSKSSI